MYGSFLSLTDVGQNEVQILHVSKNSIIGHMRNVDEEGKETDLVGIIGTYGIVTWRREWLPTPGFLPGESHGQRSLAGYGSWGHKSGDTTEGFTQTRVWHPKIPIVSVMEHMHHEYFHLENRELLTIFTTQCTRSVYLCSLS